MPLYEYQCESCAHRFERIQKSSDAPIPECPLCASAVRKLPSSPAIQFKGTGWYITDYARKTGASDSKSTGDGDSAGGKSGDGKSGDAKSGDGKSGDGKSGDGKSGDGGGESSASKSESSGSSSSSSGEGSSSSSSGTTPASKPSSDGS